VPPVVSQPATPTVTINRNFLTNVNQPWDVAFTPDGTTMLYTEKSGALYSVVAGVEKLLGSVTATVVSGEGGLMGLAVDPTFPTNPYVYVCTTTASGNQIVRLTVDLARPANAGITAQSALGGTNMQSAGFHNGCRVRFQPVTNALFWSMGDAGVGSLPQNLSSMNGKILRAQVVNGVISPHPDNTSNTYVFTRGHRNPQGLAFNPNLSNTPYSIEHGPGIDDEVHKLVEGGNSGWDPIPNYNQNVPMSDLSKFPSSMNPVWRSGGARTIAPSGGTFIQNIGGADWKALNGTLILAVLKDNELRVLLMNPDGSVSGQFQLSGSTGTRLRSVAQSPANGRLYVAEDVGSTGQIWEITPS